MRTFVIIGFITIFLCRILPDTLASDQTLPQKDYWYSDGKAIPIWQNTAKQKSTRFPAYQISPNPNAPKMTLTRHIIVHFHAHWNEQEIAHLMNPYKIGTGLKLPLGENIYRFQSETVAGSLALANAIYESGQVIASYPDWMILEPAR